MKKVLLSAALVFTFAFGYANERVSKKEVANEKAKTSVKKEAVAKPVVKTTKPVVMPVCFGLSCGTACDYSSNAEAAWAPYMMADTIEGTFEALELMFC